MCVGRVLAGWLLAAVLTALLEVSASGAALVAEDQSVAAAASGPLASPAAWSAPFPVSPSDAAVDLYVVRRGWHVDVGFAAGELQAPLQSVVSQFPGARYLIFGFGDRHYLMTSHRNAPVLLAALWPGRALILATGLTGSPTQAFGGSEHVVRLRISKAQSGSAQQFIWQALEKLDSPPGDQVKPYAIGPYEGSLFFAAQDDYSALHTCNTWAAEVLKAAGFPVRPAGTIFAWQVWRTAQKFDNAGRHAY